MLGFNNFIHQERQYLDLAQHVLNYGVKKMDRTGTGTLSIFGHQMRFNLSNGDLPLLTTKYVDYENILGELFAFIHGETNANVIGDKYRFKIWRKWAKDESGDLGPIYGKQWRSWPTGKMGYKEGDEYPTEVCIDQLAQVIEQIKNNPDSRRLLVNAWNVGAIDEMALPPCHLLFQFYVADGHLSLQLYQRSADLFLGVPYNIASYATLLRIIAQLTDLQPGEFIHTMGDVHIYLDHVEQMREQIKREPRPFPQLGINKRDNIDDYWFDDFALIDYKPHPAIKGKVSV
jgi:thymidylate synthase